MSLSITRREALLMAGAATLLAGETFAAQPKVKPMKVLILGGTGISGPHLVRELRDAGHQLTLLNRGKRNPGMFKDVETLLGDRAGPLDVLKGRDWDVVVDNSGYFPKHVKASAELLKGHTQHYIYVSSISAYVNLTPPGIDEDYQLAELKDPDATEITGENYGGLKAACEKIVEQTFGVHQAVIRPSYIVGPGDSTDRFGYWPVRVARGGEMLAPGTPADTVQFIDVRDMADFMRACVERKIQGRYNLCNPPGSVTIGELLEASKRISKSNASFTWASQSFIEQQQLQQKGEIPIWAPPVGEQAGATLVSSARAVAQGLRFRDLDTTIKDTLAWHEQRPAEEKAKLRAGLTAEREAQLLKQLKA
ncbi:NAD-dependent epimerase/dehydratase family protein [Steroidobacter cummioxidans]|uniref:NAD-dependent epimerase/dehydratase family protein n=1 Tax=Steroidobacter cummioxidans TaxID=1803913 RepID=UPI0019D4B3FE|nr:NAD-dependent epimerase/dehydratase family protein [Steroidobacter cummioxidans]